MNVIIIAIGSQGDLNPFLGIGRALRDRGHDVVVLSNSFFRASVQDAGLDFVSVGTRDDYTKMLNKIDVGNPTQTTKEVMTHLYFSSMQHIYDCVDERVIPGETVMVGITMAFGARIVQEKLGVPLVTCHLAPVSFPSVLKPAKMDKVWMPHWMPEFYKKSLWWLIDKASDMFLGPRINQVRRCLGLRPVNHIIRQWIHSPDQVIGLFPDWFAEQQPDWPMNTELTNFILYDEADRYPMPQDLEAFISQGDPVVVFTPGTAVKNAAPFFAESVKVCEALKIRGIFSPGTKRISRQICRPLFSIVNMRLSAGCCRCLRICSPRRHRHLRPGIEGGRAAACYAVWHGPVR